MSKRRVLRFVVTSAMVVAPLVGGCDLFNRGPEHTINPVETTEPEPEPTMEHAPVPNPVPTAPEPTEPEPEPTPPG